MTRSSFTIEGEHAANIVINAFKTFVLRTRVEQQGNCTVVIAEEFATRNDCLVHTAIIYPDKNNAAMLWVVVITAGMGNERSRQKELIAKMEEVFKRNGYVHSPVVEEIIDNK